MPRNFFLGTTLIFCTLLNTFPVFAQRNTTKATNKLDVEVKFSADSSEVFSKMQRDDGIFRKLVTKMNGGDPDSADALQAQSLYFFERFREASKDQLEKTVEKAKEAAKKRYEDLKAKTASADVKAAPIGRRLKRNHALPTFRLAGSDSTDGPQITKNERDNGTDVTGTETKIIETPTATITRTAEATSTVNFDGRQMSTSSSQTDRSEAVSKTDKRKVGKVSTLAWGAAFDVCPDEKGIIKGTGKARLYQQTTINTGRDLGALTSDTVVELKITGYVNDAAEMTHFDIEGTVNETMIGYDRALAHDLVDDTNGITDGKATAIIEIKNSTPPATAPPNEYGSRNAIDPVLGPSRIVTYDELNAGQKQRVAESVNIGVQGVMLQLDPLMRSSISRWRNYECVDVECTAPKTALKPNESVAVTAVSISKQDQSRLSANLHGVGDASITPEDQQGAPSAIYTLTAPKQEEAFISVESTSRRGIGIGNLKIPVVKPKKPPVKTPVPPKKTDTIWSGTIKVVHTEKQDREGKPSGRMLGEFWTKNKRWEVSLTVPGTRDLSGGIINNFHAQTEVTYLGRDYNEKRYGPDKMSCGRNGGIFMSPETQKFEIIEKGTGRQLLLVNIMITGTNGYIGFGAPGVQAESTVIRKYETKCASYDAVNSGTHTDPRGVSIGSPSFEVNFRIDGDDPDAVSGTKTVVNADGSEDVFTWNLTRGKP